MDPLQLGDVRDDIPRGNAPPLGRRPGHLMSWRLPARLAATPVADHMVAALTTCHAPAEFLHRVRLTLHEAVQNAVLHGCFGFTPTPDENPFQARLEAWQRGIESPQGDLSLTVELWRAGDVLWVGVQDSGAGFRRPATTPVLTGRGLTLMEGLADHFFHEPGSARVCMGFRLEPPVSLLLKPADTYRLLIVDDDIALRQTLRQVLAHDGYPAPDEAGRVSEALALPVHTYDLMLIDLTLPDGSGFDLMEALRAQHKGALPAALFLSVRDHAALRMRGFRLGAADFISKPLDVAELRDRLRAHLNLSQRRRALHTLEGLLHRQLTDAHNLQNHLLPGAAAMAQAGGRLGARVDALLIPSRLNSGDSWMLFDDPDSLSLLVADFTGHGLGAAIDAVRLHALRPLLHPHRHTPTAALATLNTALRGQLQPGKFATAVFLNVRRTGPDLEVTYAGAGWPLMLAGIGLIPVPLDGLPLGLVDTPGSSFRSGGCRLAPGERLVVASDGAFESATHTQDNGLGIPGFLDLARQHSTLPALRRALEGALRRPFADDISLVEIVNAPQGPSAGSRTRGS
jgi:sigma-B regulation protein RsbU (phosphoserine phosphatase)